MDRRSVLVQRTLKGQAFLRDLRSIMSEAGVVAKKPVPAAGNVVEHAPSRRARG